MVTGTYGNIFKKTDCLFENLTNILITWIVKLASVFYSLQHISNLSTLTRYFVTHYTQHWCFHSGHEITTERAPMGDFGATLNSAVDHYQLNGVWRHIFWKNAVHPSGSVQRVWESLVHTVSVRRWHLVFVQPISWLLYKWIRIDMIDFRKMWRIDRCLLPLLLQHGPSWMV